jgi:hypothetical protein
MKKIYALIYCLIVAYAVQAQTFAPLGAEWYGWGGTHMLGGDTWSSYSYWLNHNVVEKDTAINNMDCRQIHITQYYKNDHNSTPFARHSYEYVYDSNDSVFVYVAEKDSFMLLYRFNVTAGETICTNSFIDPEKNMCYTVDSIVTETIDNTPLKAYYVTVLNTCSDLGANNTEAFTWGRLTIKKLNNNDPNYYNDKQNTNNCNAPGVYYEKIGGWESLFPNTSELHSMGYNHHRNPSADLMCYSDAEISINTSNTPCTTFLENLLSISESTSNPNIVWNFYPNPNNGVLNIQYSAGFPKETQILLYDALGRLVAQLPTPTAQSQVYTYTLPHLPTQWYSLQIITPQGSSVKKVFINTY